MEEEKKVYVQKVYIRGISGRGKDVIKALVDLGGVNSRKVAGDGFRCIYYIGRDNMIKYTSNVSELAAIIEDNYREIVPPEVIWKEGDLVVHSDGNSFCIVDADTGKYFHPLFLVNQDCYSTKGSSMALKRAYHLADKEEKNSFLNLLHKNHLDWDFKKRQLVRWKWTPKEGENFYFITEDGEVASLAYDKNEFWTYSDFGNCFQSAEEAAAMAEKFRKLLNGGE
jgi:hypothetical protein